MEVLTKHGKYNCRYKQKYTWKYLQNMVNTIVGVNKGIRGCTYETWSYHSQDILTADQFFGFKNWSSPKMSCELAQRLKVFSFLDGYVVNHERCWPGTSTVFRSTYV